MKDHYQRGGLGDSIVKKRLLDVLEALLGPIRMKREQLAKDRGYLLQILKKGSEDAAKRSAKDPKRGCKGRYGHQLLFISY